MITRREAKTAYGVGRASRLTFHFVTVFCIVITNHNFALETVIAKLWNIIWQ